LLSGGHETFNRSADNAPVEDVIVSVGCQPPQFIPRYAFRYRWQRHRVKVPHRPNETANLTGKRRDLAGKCRGEVLHRIHNHWQHNDVGDMNIIAVIGSGPKVKQRMSTRPRRISAFKP
jgi:hypothetical protein